MSQRSPSSDLKYFIQGGAFTLLMLVGALSWGKVIARLFPDASLAVVIWLMS